MDPLILKPSPSLNQTEIHFRLDSLSRVCRALSKRGVILVDSLISETIGRQIQQILGYELIEAPKHKTREAKEAIEDELFRRKVGKDSVIVALGGGVTSDLVAFAASTYMRGVPLVLIPTTLLWKKLDWEFLFAESGVY